MQQNVLYLIIVNLPIQERDETKCDYVGEGCGRGEDESEELLKDCFRANVGLALRLITSSLLTAIP